MKFISPYSLFSASFRWLSVAMFLLLLPLILSLVYYPLVVLPFKFLLLKNFLDTLIILGLAVLLEKIIPSSYYVKFDFKQRFINYTTLAVTAVIVWVTMSYLASLLVFGPENKDVAIKLLPLTAFIGVLLYVVDIQFIHYRICKYKSNKDKEVQLEDNETDKKMIDFGGKNSKVNDYEHVTLERIALKTGQKIHVVLVPDIVYIKSDGDYVHIYTDSGKYIKEETMKYFEANLQPDIFVRVHRSYIVNVEKIARIELYEKQSQILLLKNGDQIKASNAGYKALKEVLSL